MKTSLKGILAIINEEGIVLSTYRDGGGVLTIGIGHTANAGGLIPKMGMKITLLEAVGIFIKDLAKFEAHVSTAIGRDLKQNVFDALVGFDLNTGAIKSGSVDDKILAGDYAAAARTINAYNKDNGKVVPGLVARRKREVEMFSKGIYPTVTLVKVWDVYPGKSRMVPVKDLMLAYPIPAVAIPPSPAMPVATAAVLSKETKMFKGYKTYILAGVGVITAVAGFLVGDLSLADAVQLAITSGLGATIKNAIG